MRKTFLVLALLLVGLFAFAGVASAYTPPEQYIHNDSKEVYETLCTNPQYSYRGDVWYAWEENTKFLFMSFESDQPFSLDLTDTAVPDGQSGGYDRYRPGQIRIIADEGQQVIVSSYSSARSSTYYNGQTVSLGGSSYFYEQQYYIDKKGVNDFPPGVYLNENPGNEVPWLANLTLAPGKTVKFKNTTTGDLKVAVSGKVDAVKYAEGDYQVSMVHDDNFSDKYIRQNQYVVITNTDTGNITVNYSSSLSVTQDYNKPALNQYGLTLPKGKSIRINSHSQSSKETYKIISPDITYVSYDSEWSTSANSPNTLGKSTELATIYGYANGVTVFTNEGNNPAEVWIPGEYEAITDYSKPALNQYALTLQPGKTIKTISKSTSGSGISFNKPVYKIKNGNVAYVSYDTSHSTHSDHNEVFGIAVEETNVWCYRWEGGYAVFTNEGSSLAEVWIPGEYEAITDYNKPALNQYGLTLPKGKSIKVIKSTPGGSGIKIKTCNVIYAAYNDRNSVNVESDSSLGKTNTEKNINIYQNGYTVITNQGSTLAEVWIPGEYEAITDYSKPALNQYALSLQPGKSIKVTESSGGWLTYLYKIKSSNVAYVSYDGGLKVNNIEQDYIGITTGERDVRGQAYYSPPGYAVFTNEGSSPAEVWIPGEYEAITDYGKPALLISMTHPTRYNCLINNSQAYAPDADYVIYTAANEIRKSGTAAGAISNINAGEYIVITPKSLPQTVYAPGEQFTMQEKGYKNINIPPIVERDLSNGQPGAVNIDIPGGNSGSGSNPPEKYMHSSSKSNWQYLDNNPMYTYRYDFWYPWEGNAEFLFISIESNSPFTIDFSNAGVESGTSGGYKYYSSGSVVVNGSPNQQIWYTDYSSRRSSYTLNSSGTRSFSLSGSGSWYEQQYYIDNRGVTDYIPQIYKFDKNGTPMPTPEPGETNITIPAPEEFAPNPETPGSTNINIPAPTPKDFTPGQAGGINVNIPAAGNRELKNGQPGNSQINAPAIIDRPLIHGQPGSVNFTVTGSGGRTFDQGTPGAQNITIPEAQQRELNHGQGGTVNIVIK